jgi:hypothetical protein
LLSSSGSKHDTRQRTFASVRSAKVLDFYKKSGTVTFMKLNNTPCHSSKMFTWTGKTGVADLSDFNGLSLWRHIYDDAADIGFEVVSSKTGVKLLFSFESDELDAEGDLVALHFINQHGYKITILND